MAEETTTTDEANTEDTKGLKAKNAELVGKLKVATTSLTTLQSRLEALEEAQNDALDTTKSDAEKNAQKLQRQIEALTTKLTASEQRASALLVDGAISDAIAKNGVLPQYARAVTAMLKADAKMENGEAVANGIPLTDHIKEFFAGEEGKHFVAAAANSGGSAMGSSAKASLWSKPPTTAQELNDWDNYLVANPVHANSLADGWNRPDLNG